MIKKTFELRSAIAEAVSREVSDTLKIYHQAVATHSHRNTQKMRDHDRHTKSKQPRNEIPFEVP